jgi:hypothetical protein
MEAGLAAPLKPEPGRFVLIEAFSAGKNPADPAANEDRFVVLPGRAYAVIDGVSDRTGARYEGILSGRYAALVAGNALEAALAADRQAAPRGDRLIDILTQAIAAEYARLGILDIARKDHNFRFAATLALFVQHQSEAEIVLVGDSGVRVNGTRVLRVEKDLDFISATLRRHAWTTIAERTDDPEIRHEMSRRVTLHGTRHSRELVVPHLDAAALDGIEQRSIAAARASLPAVPVADIEAMVQGGIVNAQKRYQNNADSPLGYSCLDGFAVPDILVQTTRIPLTDIKEVELFSDGYFKLGEDFGVEAWEAAFAEVEAVDPEKISLYPSVRGSQGGLKADDRTYLGVRL